MTPNVSEHASMVNDVGGLLMVLDRCWEVVLALFGLPHFFFSLGFLDSFVEFIGDVHADFKGAQSRWFSHLNFWFAPSHSLIFIVDHQLPF